jgi:serine/threonine-protein kinase
MPLASSIDLPDRYRVVRHIASGGMASVWEAEDLLLGRLVAVKVLAPQFAADPDARERFQREARTAAQVSNQQHVMTIYDIGEHGDEAFIVMEHFAGGTVADRLRAARDAGELVPRETALRWLREAAVGLDVAHAAGIVHRDVKPANLLLDANDRLAVGDFGIAKLADDAQMTQTGQVLGTAAYISPEQALGRPAGPASDRYALAVVAHELLTGSRPFPGGPPMAQARQHAEAKPTPPSVAAPELPAALDGVLARGLAKDPDHRPHTATELVAAIESALGEGPEPEPTRPFDIVAAAAPLGAALAGAVPAPPAPPAAPVDAGPEPPLAPAVLAPEPEAAPPGGAAPEPEPAPLADGALDRAPAAPADPAPEPQPAPPAGPAPEPAPAPSADSASEPARAASADAAPDPAFAASAAAASPGASADAAPDPAFAASAAAAPEPAAAASAGGAPDPAPAPAAVGRARPRAADAADRAGAASAATGRARPRAADAPAPMPPRAPRVQRLRPRAPAPQGRRDEPPARTPDRGDPARRRAPWPALLGVALLSAAAVGLVLALSGGGAEPGGKRAGRTQSSPASSKSSRTATTAAAEPPAPPPPPAQSSAGAGTSPSALNDRGYKLIQQGRYGEAVEPLRAAVTGYQSAGEKGLPYAFALYNLAVALNRSGNPAEAVPLLRERLKFDNQRDTVQAELDDALVKLGQAPEGKAKGNGKAKKNKGDGDKG